MKNENISIYRFTSFESFVDIVQNQKLAFVNHELWEDPYEGYVFKALKSIEGRMQMKAITKKLIPDDSLGIMILGSLSNCIHGQSWSKCEESDALWRIYSNSNKAIRIEIDRDDVDKLKDVTYNEIDYVDFSSLEEEIQSLIYDEGKKFHVDKILTRKRTAFKHEKEIRLLTKMNFDYLPDNKTDHQREIMNQGFKAMRKAGKMTEQEFQSVWEKNNEKKNLPKVVFIDFSHIQGFIKSILIHPLAPNWYVDTVKDYCKKNKIKFIGKSKLYTLKFG